MSKTKAYIGWDYYLYTDKSNIAYYHRTGNKSALFFAKNDGIRVLDEQTKIKLVEEAIRLGIINKPSI